MKKRKFPYYYKRKVYRINAIANSTLISQTLFYVDGQFQSQLCSPRLLQLRNPTPYSLMLGSNRRMERGFNYIILHAHKR